jgi:hypothetical protein
MGKKGGTPKTRKTRGQTDSLLWFGQGKKTFPCPEGNSGGNSGTDGPFTLVRRRKADVPSVPAFPRVVPFRRPACLECYRRVDAKTLEIEATVEDPKVRTKPWLVPKQTLTLAPFAQIMELACSDNDTQTAPDAPEPPKTSARN